MSPERGVILALASTGLVLIPAAFNVHSDPYLREAVLMGRVDCGGRADALDPEHPYDAIVVPGAGTVTDDNGNILPSFHQRVRLQAAVVALTKEVAPRVVLLNGTGSDEDQSAGNEFLIEAAQENGAKLHNDNILTEDTSVNTATNMRELAKIAKNHNLHRVAIVTGDSHLNRATMLACINGVSASPISAEDLLGESEETFSSPLVKFTTHLKERIEIALLMWDPYGTIPTFVRRLLLSLS